jgi:menaquinone-dependent protoporphyrinogen oxidase
MKRILVVFGSKTGCTQGIAKRIAETLGAQGVEVDTFAAADAPAPAAYDAVVVGSGVRAGNWHAPAREWVAANAEALRKLPVALYTVGLTLASDPDKTAEVRAYTDAVVADAGLTPVDIGVFAGWNEPKAFPLVERLILKAMKAPVGDFRDWAAVESWAEKIEPQLGA